jgi:hypothetical protein
VETVEEMLAIAPAKLLIVAEIDPIAVLIHPWRFPNELLNVLEICAENCWIDP